MILLTRRDSLLMSDFFFSKVESFHSSSIGGLGACRESSAASMATLIVGDGNFSFAHALIRAGRLPHSASGLTATSYDSKQVWACKAHPRHDTLNLGSLDACSIHAARHAGARFMRMFHSPCFTTLRCIPTGPAAKVRRARREKRGGAGGARLQREVQRRRHQPW